MNHDKKRNQSSFSLVDEVAPSQAVYARKVIGTSHGVILSLGSTLVESTYLSDLSFFPCKMGQQELLAPPSENI